MPVYSVGALETGALVTVGNLTVGTTTHVSVPGIPE